MKYSPWPVALTGGLVALYAARVALAPRVELAYPLLVAAVGPLVEAALIEAGMVAYTRPGLGPVALWLPALYLHVGLAGSAVSRDMRHCTRPLSARRSRSS